MSASEMNTTVTGSCLCGSVRYEVSGEAERFYNCFCQRCGGLMPRVVPELDGVLIPAGSLRVFEKVLARQGSIHTSFEFWRPGEDSNLRPSA